MSNNSLEYVNYMMNISGAKNIQKKMTTCGKHMVKYDNCVDNGNKFDECYHLYYQKFLQCCKEIDIKDKNRKKLGKN
jgi:hypothetical protein